MARTRVCKARSRPPSRSTITRVTSGHGSTVESLRASTVSVEDNKDKRSYLRGIDREDSTVKIKQEDKDEDVTAVNETRKSPKRRAQETKAKAPVAKKHKSSPPAVAARLTRSKTLPHRREASSTRSDSESESDIETDARTKTRSINSPLRLLRPYMAFQLSISGLSGKAYNAAQASMKSVLDVAENFGKQRGGTLARAYDSLSSSSSVDSEKRESPNRQKRAEERQTYKVAKLGAKRDDDVLPRKQQELNEQTRKRLAQERKGRGRARRYSSEDEDSSAHSSSRSSSTTTSDTATEIASDTEDEAKYPPIKLLSVSSTTSIYDSLRASTTDSGETSSEGEESDVIERREKNALRRRKARQKKRNAWKREEVESASEAETEMNPVEEMEEASTPVMTGSDCGREVIVNFCPIAW